MGCDFHSIFPYFLRLNGWLDPSYIEQFRGNYSYQNEAIIFSFFLCELWWGLHSFFFRCRKFRRCLLRHRNQ